MEVERTSGGARRTSKLGEVQMEAALKKAVAQASESIIAMRRGGAQAGAQMQ